MKIKSIKKYEDDSRLINVNFATSMIENSQVSIGMKYFVIEFYNKQKMGYAVRTALDDEGLVKELCACSYGMTGYNFYLMVKDIVKETPKFCYVYGNIWKHVLKEKYGFTKSVKEIEKAIDNDVNTCHRFKLYDLLHQADKEEFEKYHPEKERKDRFYDKMRPTTDYAFLYNLLWDWFNELTKGKYELVDDIVYSKAKKAEERLSILKYTELDGADFAEVSNFVQRHLVDKGWYHNTGEMDITTSDGSKLRVSDVDTVDLAVSCDNLSTVYVIGDYLFDSRFDISKWFKGADRYMNPVHYEVIDNNFRRCLKMEWYSDTHFYEKSYPYGRFGYRSNMESKTLYITNVSDKSIQFIAEGSTEEEKRKLEKRYDNGKTYNSFKYFKFCYSPRCNLFTPELLLDNTKEEARRHYEEAVKQFGKPIVEQDTQDVSEQELVMAASEAL